MLGLNFSFLRRSASDAGNQMDLPGLIRVDVPEPAAAVPHLETSRSVLRTGDISNLAHSALVCSLLKNLAPATTEALVRHGAKATEAIPSSREVDAVCRDLARRGERRLRALQEPWSLSGASHRRLRVELGLYLYVAGLDPFAAPRLFHSALRDGLAAFATETTHLPAPAPVDPGTPQDVVREYHLESPERLRRTFADGFWLRSQVAWYETFERIRGATNAI